MLETVKTAVAMIGIDVRKNSFHVISLNQRGATPRGTIRADFAATQSICRPLSGVTKAIARLQADRPQHADSRSLTCWSNGGATGARP